MTVININTVANDRCHPWLCCIVDLLAPLPQGFNYA